MGLGWFISAPLVTRLVKAAMVQSNYRVQRYDFDDSQYYETKIAGQVTPEHSSDDEKDKGLQEELRAAQELKDRANSNKKKFKSLNSSAQVSPPAQIEMKNTSSSSLLDRQRTQAAFMTKRSILDIEDKNTPQKFDQQKRSSQVS